MCISLGDGSDVGFWRWLNWPACIVCRLIYKERSVNCIKPSGKQGYEDGLYITLGHEEIRVAQRKTQSMLITCASATPLLLLRRVYSAKKAHSSTIGILHHAHIDNRNVPRQPTLCRESTSTPVSFVTLKLGVPTLCNDIGLLVLGLAALSSPCADSRNVGL